MLSVTGTGPGPSTRGAPESAALARTPEFKPAVPAAVTPTPFKNERRVSPPGSFLRLDMRPPWKELSVTMARLDRAQCQTNGSSLGERCHPASDFKTALL